jgi:hypothetical protein
MFEPKCVKPMIEAADDNLTRDRIDTELPRATESKTDK